MATQVVDGYDHYNSLTDILARSGFLQYQSLGGQVLVVNGLSGYGKAIELGASSPGNQGLSCVYAARNTEAIVGWRFLFNPESGCTFVFQDTLTNTPQVTVFFNENNYAIQIYRGSLSTGTLLATSANNVWTNDTAQFLEFDVKIDSSSGKVVVSIDEVQYSYTGLNTKNTVNSTWDAVNIFPQASATVPTVVLDDHYYNDTTMGPGTFPMNGFAGDSRISTQFMTGNDVVQFTPLANTNWQEISEVAMDSDASYNYDNNAGDQDTFVPQPLLAQLSTIYCAQLTYAARNDGSGPRTIAGVVKIGGTSYVFGSPHSISAAATYAYFSDLWTLSPATGLNFTRTEVNGADFGYKLVT